MKTLTLSVLYFLTGIIFIILQYKPVFSPDVAVKALIMPLLIVILMVNLWKENTGKHRLFILALVFSWAGDIALAFTRQNEMMFITGLLCFLVTQLLYFIVFFFTPVRSYAVRKSAFSLLPVYAFGAAILFYMFDDLGELRIPVIVYTFVILTMLAGAITRINKVSRISFYLVLFGAVLFVLSDSILAINKFSNPFMEARALNMSTYICGQFLIVMGYIKQYGKALI